MSGGCRKTRVKEGDCEHQILVKSTIGDEKDNVSWGVDLARRFVFEMERHLDFERAVGCRGWKCFFVILLQ